MFYRERIPLERSVYPVSHRLSQRLLNPFALDLLKDMLGALPDGRQSLPEAR
jgi:hypothetical protein